VTADTADKNKFKGLLAWASYDWANSGFSAVVETFVFAAYFTRQVAPDPTAGTALWGYALGVGGLLIALAGPPLGAIADQGGRLKPWLAGFTALCVAATAGLWFVLPDPAHVPLALALVLVGTLALEAANIFYNAMLPRLASPDHIGRWSGWGWALGYAGGLACVLIVLFLFVSDQAPFGLDRAHAEHIRITGPFVAAWLFVFALPLFLWTTDRKAGAAAGRAWSRQVRAGFRQLRASVRNARRYSGIWRFLIARMFYNDGLTTLFAFGGVFAAGAMNMSEADVLWFAIALQVTAALGAFGFAWVDDRLGARFTIMVSLCALAVVTTAVLFVTSAALFWSLGMAIGIFVGPAQAASRSWLARAAPPEMEVEMFGLFALSGKVTAFLGPLLVGWVTWFAGSQRVGMAVIPVLLLVGLVLMLWVPAENKLQVPGSGFRVETRNPKRETRN
jgi:UMF1 family MFS transporter